MNSLVHKLRRSRSEVENCVSHAIPVRRIACSLSNSRYVTQWSYYQEVFHMRRTRRSPAGIRDVFARFGKVEALQEAVRGHVTAIEELLEDMGRIAGNGGAGARGKRGRGP